jgi:hypothetical protein
VIQTLGQWQGRALVAAMLGDHWHAAGEMLVRLPAALAPLGLGACWNWVYVVSARNQILLRWKMASAGPSAAALMAGGAWGVPGLIIAWVASTMTLSAAQFFHAFARCPVPAVSRRAFAILAMVYAVSIAQAMSLCQWPT